MAMKNTIGMSVPGASSLLGAQPSLSDQVDGESEEQRKKRLQAMRSAQTQPGANELMGSSYGAALPPG